LETIRLIGAVVSFIGLIIATQTDLDRREVPDWLNYFLLVFGLFLAGLLSIVYSDYWYIVASVSMASIAFGLGALMYYTGQWGGGDAKMLAALGALLATTKPIFGMLFPYELGWVTEYNILFVPVLFFQILIAGALYGIGFSLYMGIAHRKKWYVQMKKLFATRTHKILRFCVFAIALIVLSIGFLYFDQGYATLFGILAIMILITYYIGVSAKAVELACMYRQMPVSKLTEGEWIAKDILKNGKRICGPSDLGISKNQIVTLKKLGFSQVLVKVGIPFIPAFLAGFIATILFGNILFFIF